MEAGIRLFVILVINLIPPQTYISCPQGQTGHGHLCLASIWYHGKPHLEVEDTEAGTTGCIVLGDTYPLVL